MIGYEAYKHMPRQILLVSLLFLTAAWMPRSVQSQGNSPLSPEEKRTILLQLHELKSCRETTAVYGQYVARDKEQDGREKANYERSLELEKEATRLANERAKFYEDAFKSVTRKPGGFGCVMGKIFTLGLYRCK